MLFKMVRIHTWLSWIGSRCRSVSCINSCCLSKLWIMSTIDELTMSMWFWKRSLRDGAERASFTTCLLRVLANTDSGRCVGRDSADSLPSEHAATSLVSACSVCCGPERLVAGPLIADGLTPDPLGPNPLFPNPLFPDLLCPNPLGPDPLKPDPLSPDPLVPDLLCSSMDP